MPQRFSVPVDIYANGILAGPEYQLVATAESAGSDRVDLCTLVYDGIELEDLDLSLFFGVEIEVVRPASGAVWHWGKITQAPMLLSSSSGETLQLVSRAEPYHLGERVDGYWVWDPITSDAVLIDGDLVFNPMIDGKIYGNLNDTQLTAGGGPLLLDPESVKTAAAQTLQGANVELWSLAGAVFYLLDSLNAAQTNISNPTLVALSAIFSVSDLVQDVRIPRGMYLGQALDLLINPLGYQWRVKRTAVGAREFEFFKRGTGGTLVAVYHQRLGDSLTVPRNLTETNVDTAGITFDTSRLANEITVRGGFGEYEVTVELHRAWAEADDPPAGGSGDEYAMDHADFDDVRNVMRKWVLNEAGDYIGLRPEIDDIFTPDLLAALSGLSILDEFIPRRRKLMPTLTLDDDLVPIGRVDGVEVEYSNTDPAVWLPVVGWPCQLLSQEAGIYFNSEKLPEEFLKAPDDFKIRVTATIQNDYRLTGYAPRVGLSPQPDVAPLVIDVADRFRYKVRHSSLSKYGGGATPSLAVNDSTAVQDFAEFCRDAWDLMDIGGAIQIEGLDNDYKVGDRVEQIALKNISFLAKTGSSAYPQIIAVERHVNSQTTVLHLQRQREPIPLPVAPQGNTPRFRTRQTARDVI